MFMNVGDANEVGKSTMHIKRQENKKYSEIMSTAMKKKKGSLELKR